MKKTIFVGSLVAMLFAGFLLVHAAEQQQPQPQQKAGEQKGEAVPPMPMNPQMMMQNMMGMMQQAGVDPNMMRRCQAMMFAPVFLDSPAAIRGQAESLGLSDEQKQKLLDIENEARQKARSVLTEEQIKKMGEVPDKPIAMMEMCQQMSAKMMPMMQQMMPMMQKMMSGGSPGQQPMMMCPMCPMMRMMMGGQGAAQGSEPKQDK
ncbi:MAG: Spy/CpxP family protein refolding chaperone [Thermodesulfobacteriota bacterium]